MMNTKTTQRLWVVLIAGLIIGLVLAATLKITKTTQASIGEERLTSETSAVSVAKDSSSLSVAEQLSNAFANVAQKVNPSVVTIFTETTLKVQNPFSGFQSDPFFRHFFQIPQQPGDMKQMGLGSGVIVDASGVILTNNHVVEHADAIKVRLMDGREFKATVKGTDPQTDLAVIEIDVKGLRAIKLGNSDKARVGDWVLAIGSPMDPNLDHTVTAGIISAKGRSGVGLTHYEDYIQTDAAINPGNSGGAMVNMRGQLIGINSAIVTKSGGNMGIGFAIPINLARKVMNDIIEKGMVVRGWLGVYIQNITPDIAKAMKLRKTNGVIVSKVQEGSPAEKAGMKAEDIIVKFDGKKIKNNTELSTMVAGTSPGSKVEVEVLRDGKMKTLTVKLEELNPISERLASGETNYKDIGIKVSNITSEMAGKYHLDNLKHGVVITSVDEKSIAAEVGLHEGDVILKLNRQAIDSVEDFNKILSKQEAGDTVLFYILRGENNLFLAFTLPKK